jgi:hypothetical protein
LFAVQAVLLIVFLAVGCDGEQGRLNRTPAKATAECSGRWGPATETGKLPGGRREVSGFVSSPRHAGVAWMVRDSGNPASLYSFEIADGAVRSKEFPVEGASNGDWEDLAYTTGADGRGRLWVLDNINRNTAPKTLYEVLEPDPARDRSAQILNRYRWEYPDGGGNHDTEVLFAFDGKLTVVSKTTPSRAYRFEAPLDPAAVNRPVLNLTVPEGSKLTLGSTSADERYLLASSTKEDTVWVYEGFFLPPPVFVQPMSPSQREAGDFFPHGGCDIVLVSEQEGVWLLPAAP